MSTKVKICGLKTEAALDAALEGDADFVGFNFFPPSPRSLSPSAAAALAGRARGRARSVAVLVDPADALLEQIVAVVEPDLIQLHGHEDPARVGEIKRRFGRPVVKAVGIESAAQIQTALDYRDVADLILFDARAPASLAGALPGGNGLSFDWHLLDRIRDKVKFMLSGGLTANTVAAAIQATGPYAVDVSSGVETAPGEKSPELIRRFLAAVKSTRVPA